jgi:exodeoxyribonuclease VII large subunit
LSPLAVLGRGYALCWSAERRVLLRDATPDLVGRRVSVDLARGALDCQVTAVVPAATTPSTPVQPQTGDAS